MKKAYLENLSKRIRKCAELVGGGTQLSQKTAIPRRTLETYLAGNTEPKISTLVAIAQAAGVSLEWLAEGKGPMKPDETSAGGWKGRVARPLREIGDTEERIDPDEFYYVPMVDVKLAAGHGAFVHSEKQLDFYAFRKEWLHRISLDPKQVVLMTILGDSMEPLLINGDTVMIDLLRRTVYDGCLYAIRLDDVVLVKTLQSLPGGEIKIISENKEEYPPFQTKKEEIHIIGQIIWFARELIS